MSSSAAAGLPDDVLGDIFRRLPARSLAASRRACKAWLTVVDEQQLLIRLRRLLPNSVHGLFINYKGHGGPRFFARPTAAAMTGPRIDGRFHFVNPKNMYVWRSVLDHWNGLVLYREHNNKCSFCVCNPMTQQMSRLPWRPDCLVWQVQSFLVYDPAASKHYKVLQVAHELSMTLRQQQRLRRGDGIQMDWEEDRAWVSMEWPPARWTCHKFSSDTGRWQDRVFVREGEAAGTAALLMDPPWVGIFDTQWRYAVYLKGTLYLHCHGEYVARLNLSNNSYRVIKSPIDRAQSYSNLRTRTYIGRSRDGVTFSAIDNKCQLQVWTLNESRDGTAEAWVLKHQSILRAGPWQRRGDFHKKRCDGPWILDKFQSKNAERNKADWSSDDDDIIHVPNWNSNRKHDNREIIKFLGFHPHKEIIFLCSQGHEAVAYHLDRPKVQYLGIVLPSERYLGVTAAFVYTPCLGITTN